MSATSTKIKLAVLGVALLVAAVAAIAAWIRARRAAPSSAPPARDASPSGPAGGRDALDRALRAARLDPATLTPFAGAAGRGIVSMPVDARRATELAIALRPPMNAVGWCPVVLVDEEGLADGLATADASPADVIARAAALDVDAWRKEVVALDPATYEVERGDWVEAEPAGYVVPFDVRTKAPRADVRLAFVPTPRPHEVLAWFHWGGFNNCPPPHVHVAVHRRWAERYGAAIVTLSPDVVEMEVTRAPRDRADAEALAHEQFVYTAGDLVHQGTGTLRALASTLLGGPTWFFWWD